MSTESLVITISGCSGGHRGPQGIYNLFQQLWNDRTVTVLQFNTLPESVEANVIDILPFLKEGDSYCI